MSQCIPNNLKEMSNINADIRYRGLSKVDIYVITNSETTVKNKAEINQELLYRYRLLYNDPFSIGIKDTIPKEVLAENKNSGIIRIQMSLSF